MSTSSGSPSLFPSRCQVQASSHGLRTAVCCGGPSRQKTLCMFLYVQSRITPSELHPELGSRAQHSFSTSQHSTYLGENCRWFAHAGVVFVPGESLLVCCVCCRQFIGKCWSAYFTDVPSTDVIDQPPRFVSSELIPRSSRWRRS